MEKNNEINVEELKKYLQGNGLDEELINSPVFTKRIWGKTSDSDEIHNLQSYFDKDKNCISTYIREMNGRSTKGPQIRVKQEGKVIILERLYEFDSVVHYGMDDPIGIENDSEKKEIKKSIYYFDEKGQVELARETRRNFRLNMPVSELDLYDESAEVIYEVNEDSIKKLNPSDYHFIIMMGKMLHLQNDLENLQTENKKQCKMLEKTLSFAETVRKSKFGRLFFGKKIKDVLGEKNNNEYYLPTSEKDIEK